VAERNVSGVREDPIERVDRVIERLDGALRTAGFDPLAPASEPESVGEVERPLAPYTLPPDLRRFWDRVDFSGLRVTGWTLPEPRDPRPALEAHRQNLEEAQLLFGPPLLFPIARISGDQWSIELVSRWGPGGTVFSQDTGADERQIEYASFNDLLEVYVELKHPLYGDSREIAADPARWPSTGSRRLGSTFATGSRSERRIASPS
jgi:hypothetical protein